MRKLPLIVFLALSLNMTGQKITKDEIKIDIVKTKQVNNVSVFGIRQLKVKSDKLQKVMIKTKIHSEPNNKTKMSRFSLVDTKNKIRYRLADYKGYAGFIGSPELIPFRKIELFDKKGNPIQYGPSFDKSEKDYFYDFDKEGYKNFEIPINFGSKKNPKLSVLYFGTTRYNKFTAELFFAILKENKNSDFELYYNDEKISDIKF